MEKAQSKIRILHSPAEKSSGKLYELADFLDPVAYDREWKDISERTSMLSPSIKALLNHPGLTTKYVKRLQEFAGSVSARSELGTARQSLTKPLERVNTLLTVNLICLMRAAENFLVARSLEKQTTIAREVGFLNEHAPLEQINQFSLCGETYVKIGGVSIKDAMEGGVSPASLYRFFMEASLIRRNLSRTAHERVLKENSDLPLALVYPNVTKKNIQVASGFIISLSNFTPDRLAKTTNKFFPNPSKGEVEILICASNMVKIAHKSMQKFYDIIFSPNSPNFPALKDKVEEYLKCPDKFTRVMALQTLRIGIPERTVGCYRRARELAGRNSQTSKFYQLLADSLREFIEESPSNFGILTLDDLVPIINGHENTEKVIVPTIESLHKIAKSISQRSETREFSPSVDQIDWTIFAKPFSVRLVFPHEGSREFNILLYYENENKETFDLTLKFARNADTNTVRFEWSFLESPNDPKAKPVYDAFLITVGSILSNVQRGAEEEWLEKQKGKEAVERPTVISAPTIQNPPLKKEWIPRPKMEKTQAAKPLTPVQEVLENEVSPSEAKEVKLSMLMPQDLQMQVLMAGLSTQNQEMILRKIREFNEEGKGRFKALGEYKTAGGKQIYELRAGDCRVLAVEIPSQNGNGNGQREFEIYRIGDRKEIFKKKQKI